MIRGTWVRIDVLNNNKKQNKTDYRVQNRTDYKVATICEYYENTV